MDVGVLVAFRAPRNSHTEDQRHPLAILSGGLLHTAFMDEGAFHQAVT